MDNEFTEKQLIQLKGKATLRMASKATLQVGPTQRSRLLGRILVKQMRRHSETSSNLGLRYKAVKRAKPEKDAPAMELWKSTDFFNGFSDLLLRFVPPEHRERAHEPAKCDAEASRFERFEKDGNEVAANREYHREMRKVVFFTFLTLPLFLVGEILAQVRGMVAR